MDLAVLEPLREDLRARYGFVADLSHTAIVGTCRACAHLPASALQSDDG